jgi:hypothetical protein
VVVVAAALYLQLLLQQFSRQQRWQQGVLLGSCVEQQ